MAWVCWLNQLSSARENVVVAAIGEQQRGQRRDQAEQATMRACRRAPATFFLQARTRPTTCTAITASMATTSSTLMNERGQHHIVARHDRREAGQDEVGGKARDHRQADDDEAAPECPVAGAGQRRAASRSAGSSGSRRRAWRATAQPLPRPARRRGLCAATRRASVSPADRGTLQNHPMTVVVPPDCGPRAAKRPH